MTQPGGTADKLGNRYEDRWTAHQAFLVLREQASSIRLEPLGVEGEGVEFWIRYRTHIEYHQVKRQRTGHGKWTLSSLGAAGVLATFYAKLQDPDAQCVFVSTHAADTLEELAERARSAVSYEEYIRDALGTQTRKLEFEALCKKWNNADPQWCYEALCRVHVETIGENPLKDLLTLEAEIVLGTPALTGAVATLIEILRDRVNQESTAHDLWHALATKGYEPNPWASAPTLIAALVDANSRFVSSRQTTLIRGELLARPETRTILDLIAKESVVLVDGTAGAGKSDVLLAVTEQLANDGIPHLAVRLDRLDPTARPEDLGGQLGLPGSPPAVLAAAAQGGRSVLIVDQLDIVGTTSGRSPAFFACIDEMLRSAETQPEMRLVVACRTFDRENDARLRQLLRDNKDRPVVTVGHLSADQVRETVDALGFDSAQLSEEQTELLRVPLHLALLAQIAESTTERVLGFTTVQDLYDAFWKDKRADVDQRLARTSRWVEVLDRLVDYMSTNQVLRAPRELIDEWEADAEAMVSTNMLVQDGSNLAFFHEAYFDYVFARRFAVQERTLEGLLGEDQYLFRRAQVRQILTHERSTASSRFISDLTYVLTSPEVRFHIKDLVLAWLSQVAEPSAFEWGVLETALQDPTTPIFARAWNVLSSPGWFRFVDGKGLIERWLAAEEAVADRTVSLLMQLDATLADRVAELLSPHVNESEQWDQRITRLLNRAQIDESRAMLDLVVRMLDVDDRETESLGVSDFWFVVHDLPEKHPDWGCELLGAYLRNRLRAADRNDVRNPFSRSSGVVLGNLHLRDFVVGCATGAPDAFIEHVFPVMVALIERTATPERPGGGLVSDEIWRLRHLSDVHGHLDAQLLLGAEIAIAGVARNHMERFDEVVATQSETRYETLIALLYVGFGGHPEEYADAAIDFVLGDGDRLAVGYAGNGHWATRRLLEAVTPYASNASLAALESRLLSYYTRWERSVDGRQGFGYRQFELLGGIRTERRSVEAQKRYAELQRKFGGSDAAAPQGIVGGTVQSPIADHQAEKMNDDQWQRAIARHASDDFHSRKEFLKGGAHQLSSVLERRTTEEPQRFAQLAVTLPDETNPAYFDAILRGVGATEHDVAVEDVRALVERCHALPEKPCGRWLGHAMRRLADGDVPADLLEILSWYARESPDPATDRETEGEEAGEEGENLFQHGLNTVRGGIADDIARLIWARRERFEDLRPTVEALVTDRVNAVRAEAAEILLPLLGHYSDEASDYMVQLAEGADDRVLATPYVHEFLRVRAVGDFARLQPIIERMVDSPVAEVRREGAVQAALVSLREEAARPLLEKCLQGDDSQRLGVAQVFAANLASADLRSRCEAALVDLFEDPSPKVREAAGDAVRRLDGDGIGEFEDLVGALIQSSGFVDSQDDVLFALRETTARVPGITLDACERVLLAAGGDAGDIRMAAARQAHEVSKLLVRAYADSDDPALRERALDLIDRSLELNIWGANRSLQEHDRH